MARAKAMARKSSARLPRVARDAMEESLDREMRRWLRHLIIADHAGHARRLTDAEIRLLLAPQRTRPAASRRRRGA